MSTPASETSLPAAHAGLADLAGCASEPIRVPGAIQPHGRLLVLDTQARRPLAWSANWPEAELDEAQAVHARAGEVALAPGDPPVGLGSVMLGGHPWDVAAHRVNGQLLLEFEPAPAARTLPAGELSPIYSLTRQFLPRLQSARGCDDVARLAVAQMKRLTGFGRCLLYRFDEQGHGHVMAEEAEAGYERYLGHRFPASDIPAQARALYLESRFRLIPDARYAPVALRAAPGAALDARGIDLSHCGLRSVSPVHLEYMRNMGTLASLSVSIVIDGRLWGLISCHDHAPRGLGAAQRIAAEHLGHLVALQMQSCEVETEAAERLELRKLTLQLVSHLGDSDATLQRLLDEPVPLLRLARASGAAVVLNEQVWLLGETPDEAATRELAHWVAGLDHDVHATAALAAEHPDRVAPGGPAGMLAVSISQVHRHVILWFRPEVLRSITWAGDPRKPADADGRLHPRRSFGSWVEQIEGQSLPWSGQEVVAARELREALIGIVLRRAEEFAEVANELGRVNKELEAFSYSVSHDLRAPMRHIAGYVDLVVDTEGTQLSQRGRRYLAHVKDAAAFAGQLVDALLDFSRMGRSALSPRDVDSGQLVRELATEIGQTESARAVRWELADDLPMLRADPLLLKLALRNLMSNAVKYSRGRDPARVSVRGVGDAAGLGLEVRDNGVGFDMRYVAKLFGVFQRLHQAEEFEGTGIGLANVKRIVERHGGRVWADSDGSGARFGFMLPRTGTQADAPLPVDERKP